MAGKKAVLLIVTAIPVLVLSWTAAGCVNRDSPESVSPSQQEQAQDMPSSEDIPAPVEWQMPDGMPPPMEGMSPDAIYIPEAGQPPEGPPNIGNPPEVMFFKRVLNFSDEEFEEVMEKLVDDGDITKENAESIRVWWQQRPVFDSKDSR